jgi:hypothetical protein
MQCYTLLIFLERLLFMGAAVLGEKEAVELTRPDLSVIVVVFTWPPNRLLQRVRGRDCHPRALSVEKLPERVGTPRLDELLVL